MSEEYKNGSIIHDNEEPKRRGKTMNELDCEVHEDMVELFDTTNKRIDKILRIVFEVIGGLILFGFGFALGKFI